MPTMDECKKEESRGDVGAWGLVKLKGEVKSREPKLASWDAPKTLKLRHASFEFKLNPHKKSAMHWAENVRAQYEPARRAMRAFRWHARPRSEGVAVRLFHAEAERWKNETMHWSSMAKIISHPSYLRIIGLGRRFRKGEIERLILRELEIEPYHWFDALEAITGQNPVHPDDDFDAAVNAWLVWGRREGIVANNHPRGIER